MIKQQWGLQIDKPTSKKHFDLILLPLQLELNSCISGEGIAAITKLSNLRGLSLECEYASESALQAMTTLRSLAALTHAEVSSPSKQ